MEHGVPHSTQAREEYARSLDWQPRADVPLCPFSYYLFALIVHDLAPGEASVRSPCCLPTGVCWSLPGLFESQNFHK